MQQMQQMGQPAVASMQAQQLLQAQALQMQQLQQQQQAPKPQPPKPATAPSQRQPVKRQAATHAPKKSLVAAKTQVMTKAEMGSGHAGIAKPKGWDQCLKFARFVKAQDVTGVELVRVWKSTCEPAVQSGRATERYKLMCNSLSGVVEPYAAQIDYDAEQLCDAVLAVFHDVTAVDAKALIVVNADH